MAKVPESSKKASDLALANRTLLRCYLIISIVLSAAYLLEVVKGARDIAYYAVFMAFILVPLVSSVIWYQKKQDGKWLRLLISLGYAALYTFVLYTTVSLLAFVYILPMLIAITAYSDQRFVIRIGVGVLIINAIDIVIKRTAYPDSLPDMANLEIRMAVLILCVVFLVLVTRSLGTSSQIKIDEANCAKEHSNELLEKTMSVSDSMAGLIKKADSKMSFLKESLEKTVVAMQDVTKSTSESAKAVQHQIQETEIIQKHIRRVEGISRMITEDMHTADKEIAAGHNNLEDMMEQVNQTRAAGLNATKELETLSMYAEKMETIISVIDNVTSQTNLLSLNASIEAARAGEAGKGFAVVAGEISTLAGQTSDATTEINAIVNNISAEIETVIKVIHNLVEYNQIQGDKASMTADSFQKVESVSGDVQKQAQNLAAAVEELAGANAGIVENIQTISSITEEVAAHSNETQENSELNGKTAYEVMDLVTELNGLAQQF